MRKRLVLSYSSVQKNGMEALPGTEPIFEELIHIRSANTRINQIVSNINNLDSGFIRIGTVQSIAYNWLPGVLEKIFLPNTRISPFGSMLTDFRT